MYIKKLFGLGKTDIISIQFLRYTLVGMLGLSADYASLLLLTEVVDIYYLVSAAFAFLVGLVIHYIFSIKWVFSRRKLNNGSLEFITYASLGMMGLVLNEVIIWFFTEIFAFHYLISKSFYIVIYIGIFFARKKLLFK